MKACHHTKDVPARFALIAWYPAHLLSDHYDALPGEVAVFRLFDLRELAFPMTDGACWFDWSDQTDDELIRRLRRLKREMVREYGIASHHIEDAFSRIPEYRRHRARRDRIRQKRERRRSGRTR